MEGLFDGDDLDVEGEADTDGSKGELSAGDISKLLDASAGTAGGTAAGQAGLLADLGTELEQLSGHEVIKNIMDQESCVLEIPVSTPYTPECSTQALGLRLPKQSCSNQVLMTGLGSKFAPPCASAGSLLSTIGFDASAHVLQQGMWGSRPSYLHAACVCWLFCLGPKRVGSFLYPAPAVLCLHGCRGVCWRSTLWGWRRSCVRWSWSPFRITLLSRTTWWTCISR